MTTDAKQKNKVTNALVTSQLAYTGDCMEFIVGMDSEVNIFTSQLLWYTDLLYSTLHDYLSYRRTEQILLNVSQLEFMAMLLLNYPHLLLNTLHIL
jgi:hypothetical protein